VVTLAPLDEQLRHGVSGRLRHGILRFGKGGVP